MSFLKKNVYELKMWPFCESISLLLYLSPNKLLTNWVLRWGKNGFVHSVLHSGDSKTRRVWAVARAPTQIFCNFLCKFLCISYINPINFSISLKKDYYLLAIFYVNPYKCVTIFLPRLYNNSDSATDSTWFLNVCPEYISWHDWTESINYIQFPGKGCGAWS